MAQVLVLWTITHFITEEIKLYIRLESLSGQIGNDDGSSTSTEPCLLPEADYPQIYLLLCAQIRAVAEKSASILSKSIMNDLEKRLERQFRARGFETFLIGVILLSCAEKMSWYFKTFEDPKWFQIVCEKSFGHA